MKKPTKKVQQYAVSKKKPAKQTLKCSTKGFTNLKSNAELRKKMYDIYIEKYCGKSVVNLHTKIKILFDNHSARKTSHGGVMYAEKAALITILNKICKNGHLLSVENRKLKDSTNVLGYLNFKANVIIDEKLEVAKFSVRIMRDGSFHYHIDIPLKLTK